MLPPAWILTPIESGLLYTALGVFGGASVVGFRVVAGQRKGRALRPMLTVGMVALTILLLVVALRQGRLPAEHRYEVLVLAAWGLGVGTWFVGRKAPTNILAAMTAPTLALLTLFGILLVPAGEGAEASSGAGKVIHIVLATLGFAGFSVSAGVGVLYLLQIRLMKRDPMAALNRPMPALEKLDRINFLAAAFGFPCLALSVVAGWLFLNRITRPGLHWWLDPTILVTLAGLVCYLLLFLARGFLAWRGRRIAWLSVVGFVVAVGGFVVAWFCTSPNTLHP